MRVLAALDPRGPEGARLRPAAIALALRGHEVFWSGAPPAGTLPATLRVVSGPRDLAAAPVEVVISDAATPVTGALAGWLGGAACLVMSLSYEHVRRWGWMEQSAWHSLHPLGLLEPAEASRFQKGNVALDLEGLALWSDDPPASEPDTAHPYTEVLERACERSLARHRSRAPRPAAFLDRDGTLVKEVGYLSDPGDLEILPGVPDALRALRAAGYALVVVSNQSGVGRGFFGRDRVHAAMARLRTGLRATGVELDAVYFCPHRPDAGCACRKPGTGLIERAVDDQLLSLRESAMIGDKVIDARTGLNAGMKAYLVRTGYGRDEEQRLATEGLTGVRVVDDLASAVDDLLEQR